MRQGFRLAQLDSSFLSDPKFVRLARRVPDDTTFLAAVGLWSICVAHAWANDDPDVSELMAAYPAEAAWLAEVNLLHGTDLVGYANATAAVRERRQADAERKRRGREAPVRRSPSESDGVRRSPQESAVEEWSGVERSNRTSPTVGRSPRARPRATDGPRSTGLRPVIERREA